MMMDRETSHYRACPSPGHHYQKFQKYPTCSLANYSSPPPRPSNSQNVEIMLQRNLSELSSSDLLLLAKQLKHPGITTLSLYVSLAEQHIVSRRFGDADQRTTDNLFPFTRALANAIEGWMQTLELGYSKTLRHLSFANSGLGDAMLQVLSSALQNCLPLRILNLSGCALTDASGSAVTTIVKGEDPCPLSLPQKYKETSVSEHRAPKYGPQWRKNVILIGKWSPAPALGASNSREPQSIKSSANVVGLVALDLSCNSFTDALSQELCPVLYKMPPLRALNLRCNRMTRLGAKPVLDVMKELNVLRLVDMRGNKDESLLGVLENGEHYTTFSTFQALPLPEDKKELVEWNNFVNQMTRILLNLKDGFNQLVGPTEGAIAVVAQQAAVKLHQMPSSFFRSGMLRQLDRSCRVLNSHVASQGEYTTFERRESGSHSVWRGKQERKRRTSHGSSRSGGKTRHKSEDITKCEPSKSAEQPPKCEANYRTSQHQPSSCEASGYARPANKPSKTTSIINL